MCRATFLERRGIRPLATRWAWVEGYRLCFNIPVGPGERGVANIAPDPEARLCGVLYLLEPEEFDRLDRTEGVHVGFYRRVPVEAVCEDGERVSAFTYLSAWTAEGRKPSLRYMRLLLEGAAEQGLPREYVQFLESFALAVDERLRG